MEGARMAEGLTPEQLTEAQQNFEVMKKATERRACAEELDRRRLSSSQA